MALISEIRKNVTDATPLLAVVGATDLAAERVREAAAGVGHLQQEVEKVVAQFDARPKQWRARVRELDVATVQQVPAVAVHRAKQWAQEVEQSYEHLADRGRGVVERARQAAPTQDFLRQGKATLGRAQAAVTTARNAVDDTMAAARDALTVGRWEARDVVVAVEAEVADSVTATEKVVTERTQGTRTAVRDVAETVRRRAASARTATRTATSSARETARKAVAVVEAVAGQIGQEPPTPVVSEPAALADEAGIVPADEAGAVPADEAGIVPADEAGAVPADEAGKA